MSARLVTALERIGAAEDALTAQHTATENVLSGPVPPIRAAIEKALGELAVAAAAVREAQAEADAPKGSPRR